MLHAAAQHSRDDCVKLLLAKGVSAVALDAQGRSALQLACLDDNYYSQVPTVSTLLTNGGWLPELAFDCLLNACIAGDAARLELLLEHASNSSDTSSSSSSSSSVISDLVNCTVAGGEYTLLHAAAAWGRLQCVGILLRQGLDVSGLTGADKSPAALATVEQLPRLLQREGVQRAAASDRQAVVLLLLRSGAAVETDVMHYDCYNKALQQYMQELRQQLATQTQAATVLADHVYRSSGVSISAGSGNSSSNAAQQQRRTEAAKATAKQHIVRVQLVHASTGEGAHEVYAIDTTLLAALHTQRGESGASVLANMLAASSWWGAAAAATVSGTTAAAASIKHLQYDDDLDFSELGFECVLQYYYTASVQGATSGAVDIDKLQATLQAAQFFGLDQLAASAKEFAKGSGIIIQ
eukprot:14890-Heterococcus_DN1.PRE.3